MRRLVDELKRTNQEDPRLSSTKSAKQAAEHGVAATVSKQCWAWLTGFLDPRNLFPRRFVRGQSAKILSLEILALYGSYKTENADNGKAKS